MAYLRPTGAGTKQVVDLVKLTDSERLGEKLKLTLDLQQSKRLELSFKNTTHQLKLVVDSVAGELILDRTQAGIADFETGFAAVQRAPLQIENDKVQLDILLDAASVEVFANNGRTVMTSLVFPEQPYTQLILGADNVFTIQHAEIAQLKSIWH